MCAEMVQSRVLAERKAMTRDSEMQAGLYVEAGRLDGLYGLYVW
jgi:hypothetical protein